MANQERCRGSRYSTIVLERFVDGELSVAAELPQAGQTLRDGEPAALERRYRYLL